MSQIVCHFLSLHFMRRLNFLQNWCTMWRNFNLRIL
nr:MAG TPA: hypothetical protein [Caudoviricetes sp.]